MTYYVYLCVKTITYIDTYIAIHTEKEPIVSKSRYISSYRERQKGSLLSIKMSISGISYAKLNYFSFSND